MHPDHRAGLPRFSFRKLFEGMTLIAGGMTFYGYVYRNRWDPSFPFGVFGGLAIWIASGAVVGAGLFRPFGRTCVGSLTGMVVSALVLAAIIFEFFFRF